MRVLSHSARALLAAALLSGCGGTEAPPESTGPTPEEVNRVCRGVHCTAGYCTSEGGVAACRCGPLDEEAGSVCAVDEVNDFDEYPNPGPQVRHLPVGPESGWLHRGDIDSLAFLAAAGHTYRFTCTPEGFQWCDLAIIPGPTPYDPGLVTYEGRTTVLTVTLLNTGMRVARIAAWPGGYSIDRGAYTVSLTEVEDPEGAPASSSNTVLTDGTPITGRIDFRGDVDAFAFTALEQHVYRAHCTGQDLVPVIEALGAQWEWRIFELDEEGVRTAVVKLSAGPHVLRLSTPTPPSTADYQCAIEDLGADDHPDDADHATPLPAFDTELPVTGALETRSDQDWFSFPAKAGHAYTLVCERAAPSVCAASAIQDPSWFSGTPRPPRPVVLAQDGLLRVQISNVFQNEAPSNARGPYALKVVDLGADQGTGVSDAVPASLGVPIPGLIEPFGDVDFFRVDVEPRHVYRLAFAPPLTGGVFAAFRPSAPDTNLLPIGPVPRGLFKSDRAEPIVFRIGSGQGPYVLWIDDLGMDDHGDSRDAATVIPSPALRADGLLDTADDVDWFALELEPRAYAVRNLSASFNNPSFTLFEADGTTAVPFENGTGDVRPRVAGRYYLRVALTALVLPDRLPYRWELSPR